MRLRTKVRRSATVGIAVALLAAAAVAGTTARGAQNTRAPQRITIGYQFGIGYAPLLIIKQQRLLERAYPGLEVEWKQLASGAQITDGIVRGDIQIGALGSAPMLVGWAQGTNWKVIAPLDVADLWLMVRDPLIRTLRDLRGRRIATPAASSSQAIVLKKMAEVKLGDAHALDSSLVSMNHPDGMQALLRGRIDAHLTSPPYQWLEQSQGARVLDRSYGYFGAHSFVVTVVTRRFYDDHTAVSNRFYRLVQQSINQQNDTPRVSAAILAREDATGTTAAQFRRWITRKKSLTFTTRPRGLVRTARFMHRLGLMSRVPRSWRELVFPPVYPTRGS